MLSKGYLKSLLQHHSSKALILLRSAFFIVQLSHPYMTTVFFFSNVKKSKNLYSQVYKFMFTVILKKLPIHLFKKIYMYLFGMLGLSCGTRDLSSSLQLAGSVVAVCTLFF